MTEAADLRFVQLGALALRLNCLEIEAIEKALEKRRGQAPDLLSSARLLLDLNPLGNDEPIEADIIARLLSRLKQRGFPVFGLVAGPGAGGLAEQLALPVLSSVAELRQLTDPPTRRRKQAETSASPKIPASNSLHVERQIRSGQQVYARDGDLVVHGSVSAGAELIADGSIHVYGPLRGRALAGASGEENARVYSLDFQAELVSVAGNYKVFEELPAELRGQAVQVWLKDGQLKMGRLG